MAFRLPFSWGGRLRPLIGFGSILTTGYGNHGQQPGWNPDGWTHVLCDLDHAYWLGPDDPPFLGDQDRCRDHPYQSVHACLRCARDHHSPYAG
jgi:hypothetical protein